jgi:hypothetical protein
MNKYTVVWVINIEADDALKAAFQAEDIMLKQAMAPDTGPHFFVFNRDSFGATEIDLEDEYRQYSP